MDQSGQQQHQQSVMGDANHVSHVASYPTAPMASSTAPSFSQPPVSFSPSQHQLAFQQAQHFHHQQQQQQQQQLQVFWANQIQEIEQTIDFKNHTLPLARIKKIMKADEDVRMISAEAPVVFAKACEMFILELTLRSWIHTEENKRRTLQKNDIAAAITRTDIFDFLVDIVPRDELKDESLGIPRPAPGDSMPYYYVPPQYPVAPLYNAAQQPRPPLTSYMPWQQQPQSQEQGQQSEEQDE